MDSIISLFSGDVLKHFRCGLCSGFLVDATALPECHHEFCKSCIVGYCKQAPSGPVFCPVSGCGSEIHKTRPLAKIKNDATLQTLVYKLFPDLYQDEMARRKRYYDEHPNLRDTVSTSEELGVPQSFPWLPPEVPPFITLRILFDELLVPFAELSPELRAKQGSNVMLYLSSDTSLGVIKCFLSNKHHLPNQEMVVLMYSSTLLGNQLPLSHIIRFYGNGGGTTDLTLSYIFMDVKGFPDLVTREAAIIRLIRKRPFSNLVQSKTASRSGLDSRNRSVSPSCNSSQSPLKSVDGGSLFSAHGSPLKIGKLNFDIPDALPVLPVEFNQPDSPEKGHFRIMGKNESPENSEKRTSSSSEIDLGDMTEKAIMHKLCQKPQPPNEELTLFERMKDRSIKPGYDGGHINSNFGHFVGAPVLANMVYSDREKARDEKKRQLALKRAAQRRLAEEKRVEKLFAELKGTSYYEQSVALMHHTYAKDPRLEVKKRKRRIPEVSFETVKDVTEADLTYLPTTAPSVSSAYPLPGANISMPAQHFTSSTTLLSRMLEAKQEPLPKSVIFTPKTSRKQPKLAIATSLRGMGSPVQVATNGASVPVRIQPRPIAPKPGLVTAPTPLISKPVVNYTPVFKSTEVEKLVEPFITPSVLPKNLTDDSAPLLPQPTVEVELKKMPAEDLCSSNESE